MSLVLVKPQPSAVPAEEPLLTFYLTASFTVARTIARAAAEKQGAQLIAVDTLALEDLERLIPLELDNYDDRAREYLFKIQAPDWLEADNVLFKIEREVKASHGTDNTL